jgi:hypothetical protein
MTDEPDADTDDDGSEERRKARRTKWKKALKESFRNSMPEVDEREVRSGAELDAEIAALEARMSAIEASDTAQNARLSALESGSTTPPVEPPIEPVDPPVTPPSGKRYPTRDDPACGVPAGTTLTTVSGSQTISSPGKITGKKYTGAVTVSADDVVMENCLINNGSWYGIDWKGKRGKMLRCTVLGTSGTSGSSCSGVNMRDLVIEYCSVSKWENPINVAGSGGRIRWTIVKDLQSPASGHNDGIQVDGGLSDLVIENCYLDNQKGETSATMIDNYWGAIDNVTVQNCFLGGGGFPAYLDGSFNGASKCTNVKYLNNDMRAGGWGAFFYWQGAGAGCSHTGNKHYQTGASVD